jgi:hypothetical protein
MPFKNKNYLFIYFTFVNGILWYKNSNIIKFEKVRNYYGIWNMFHLNGIADEDLRTFE